jgi:hypothetical protein
LEMEVPFGEESLIARIVGEARLQSAIFFFAYQNLVLVFWDEWGVKKRGRRKCLKREWSHRNVNEVDD